jgi:hypothetical protein
MDALNTYIKNPPMIMYKNRKLVRYLTNVFIKIGSKSILSQGGKKGTAISAADDGKVAVLSAG